ncbi:hypothetical protein U1Q18_036176 [Sarracenia purpurea var. burkii]
MWHSSQPTILSLSSSLASQAQSTIQFLVPPSYLGFVSKSKPHRLTQTCAPNANAHDSTTSSIPLTLKSVSLQIPSSHSMCPSALATSPPSAI